MVPFRSSTSVSPGETRPQAHRLACVDSACEHAWFARAAADCPVTAQAGIWNEGSLSKPDGPRTSGIPYAFPYPVIWCRIKYPGIRTIACQDESNGPGIKTTGLFGERRCGARKGRRPGARALMGLLKKPPRGDRGVSRVEGKVPPSTGISQPPLSPPLSGGLFSEGVAPPRRAFRGNRQDEDDPPDKGGQGSDCRRVRKESVRNYSLLTRN